MPPDIEPMNNVTVLGCGGTNCPCSICCCCARAEIEGPWPYDGIGGRRPSPNRLGCILSLCSFTTLVTLSSRSIQRTISCYKVKVAIGWNSRIMAKQAANNFATRKCSASWKQTPNTALTNSDLPTPTSGVSKKHHCPRVTEPGRGGHCTISKFEGYLNPSFNRV